MVETRTAEPCAAAARTAEPRATEVRAGEGDPVEGGADEAGGVERCAVGGGSAACRAVDEGEAALARGRPAEAEREFGRALGGPAPVACRARVGLGRVRLKERAPGAAAAAAEEFDRARQLCPEAWEPWYWSGCAAAHEGAYARAESHLSTALERTRGTVAPGPPPGQGEGHAERERRTRAQRGLVRVRLGRNADARDDLRWAAAHGPLRDDDQLVLARLELETERWQAAADSLRGRVRDRPEGLVLLAYARERQGRFEEALDAYTRALDGGDDGDRTLYRHGLVAHRLGRHRLAHRSWQTLRLRHPDRADLARLAACARYANARALMRRKEFGDAVEELVRCTPWWPPGTLDEAVTELRLYAVWQLAVRGEPGARAHARRHLEDVRARRPRDHRGHSYAARLEFTAGAHARAAQLWSEALRLHPDDGVRFRHALALCRYRSGEHAAAERELALLCVPGRPVGADPPGTAEAALALAALRVRDGRWGEAADTLAPLAPGTPRDELLAECRYRAGRRAAADIAPGPWRAVAHARAGHLTEALDRLDGTDTPGRPERELALLLCKAGLTALRGRSAHPRAPETDGPDVPGPDVPGPDGSGPDGPGRDGPSPNSPGAGAPGRDGTAHGGRHDSGTPRWERAATLLTTAYRLFPALESPEGPEPGPESGPGPAVDGPAGAHHTPKASGSDSAAGSGSALGPYSRSGSGSPGHRPAPTDAGTAAPRGSVVPGPLRAVVLAMSGRREAAAELLADCVRRAPTDPELNHLYAVVLLNALRAGGSGDTDDADGAAAGPAADLGERCAAAWAALLHDDTFWERFRTDAERRYATEVPTTLLGQLREDARDLVTSLLPEPEPEPDDGPRAGGAPPRGDTADHARTNPGTDAPTSTSPETPGSPDARTGTGTSAPAHTDTDAGTGAGTGAGSVSAVLRSECGGAEALAAVGGFPVPGGGVLVCGPLRLVELGLEREFGAFVAALDDASAGRRLRQAFSRLGAVQGSPGGVAAPRVDLRCVPCRVSEAGSPARGADGREVPDGPLVCAAGCGHFARANPGYAGWPDGARLLAGDALALALDTLLDEGRAALSAAEPDARAAWHSWRRAFVLSRALGRYRETQRAVVELALGSATALRGARRADVAVAVLEAAYAIVGANDRDRLEGRLALALTDRGIASANAVLAGGAQALRAAGPERLEPAVADLGRAVTLNPHLYRAQLSLGRLLHVLAVQRRRAGSARAGVRTLREAVARLNAALGRLPGDAALAGLRDEVRADLDSGWEDGG